MSEWKTIRIPSDLAEEIADLVDKTSYPSKSQFVSEAIREKIAEVRKDLAIKQGFQGVKVPQ